MSGFIIEVSQGRYISEIKGREIWEKPIVRVANDIEHAKIWQQASAVRKARSRAGMGGRVLLVSRDEKGKRVVRGQLGKEEKKNG